mmetsp:Transcript_27180/g.33579  ORF Transcript_27180/g.33579 Transcript_27180/m.33579 type:complete len:412 (+) Transcript_27180:88-1323(+)
MNQFQSTILFGIILISIIQLLSISHNTGGISTILIDYDVADEIITVDNDGYYHNDNDASNDNDVYYNGDDDETTSTADGRIYKDNEVDKNHKKQEDDDNNNDSDHYPLDSININDILSLSNGKSHFDDGGTRKGENYNAILTNVKDGGKIVFDDNDTLPDVKDAVKNLDDDINQKGINPSWIHHDCLKPLQEPIMGTHDLSRIINVGMPKCGSTSLMTFFKEDFYSRHLHCGRKGFCGPCMRKSIQANKPILASCGNFTVWTQMDFETNECIFPQISYLKEIYQEAPNATFILPFRDVAGWMNSLNAWAPQNHTIRKRIGKMCKFPELGIKQGDLLEDATMIEFLCNHVKHIRQFVHDHPSLTLIEFSIEDSSAGNFLASLFHVDASRWGKQNAQDYNKSSITKSAISEKK